jgi:hypothetical protein
VFFLFLFYSSVAQKQPAIAAGIFHKGRRSDKINASTIAFDEKVFFYHEQFFLYASILSNVFLPLFSSCFCTDRISLQKKNMNQSKRMLRIVLELDDFLL